MPVIKNRWLVILLCINMLLITALVVCQVGLPKAYGQVRSYDYILTPSRNSPYSHSLWVIDLRNQQLSSFVFEPITRSVRYGQVIDISYGQTIYNTPENQQPTSSEDK